VGCNVLNEKKKKKKEGQASKEVLNGFKKGAEALIADLNIYTKK